MHRMSSGSDFTEIEWPFTGGHHLYTCEASPQKHGHNGTEFIAEGTISFNFSTVFPRNASSIINWFKVDDQESKYLKDDYLIKLDFFHRP